jgi:hypothetical protein
MSSVFEICCMYVLEQRPGEREEIYVLRQTINFHFLFHHLNMLYKHQTEIDTSSFSFVFALEYNPKSPDLQAEVPQRPPQYLHLCLCVKIQNFRKLLLCHTLDREFHSCFGARRDV